MNNQKDTKYLFDIGKDGSIGSGREVGIHIGRSIPKHGDILIKISEQRSRSFMSRHDNRGYSVWEIDLDCGDGKVGFYIWKSDIAHRSNSDEFFAWLLEAYPVDHQFVMFNMEFFENRFTLT